jgi:hypothetical protein
MQQRDVMIKGVVDDINLMWRCFVEVWTHEEVDGGATETIWGTACTRRKRVVQSEQEENKAVLGKFYDDLFSNMHAPSADIPRSQVVLDKAVQLQVFNGLFTTAGPAGIRCHQAEYRKYTESTISIRSVQSSRAEFEGKRWVFGWSDIPELGSRAYMVSLFSEYAGLGGAFHDRLTEKYSGGRSSSGCVVGGDSRVDILSMLVSHPFVTEPNDTVVAADQTKQKIAGMIQMAQGAHAMFAGLSPPIEYAPKDPSAEYYTFGWPKEGLVKVVALGFTLRIVDQDVAFTQGLGTFIMFDVRWQRCSPSDCVKHDVADGSVEVFLESNCLINASSGTEEPLSEPPKHLLISDAGDLIKIVNMEELVSFAVETAILQRGSAITGEEKTAYRAMLVATQKATLTKAVQCDLSFIWASWVQQWTNQRKTVGASSVHFGLPTVELSQRHSSSVSDNKKTVSSLIHSVVSSSAATSDGTAAAAGTVEARLRIEREIVAEVATQEESYTTLFEKDTVRPFVASYQKTTETELALHVAPTSASATAAAVGSGSPLSPSSSGVLHTINQVEIKNSRHVFIWSDVSQLSTKEYIQGVYQQYLDTANTAYAELKEGGGRK